MAVIDTILTFGMGWLLGKGGPFGKSDAKKSTSAQPPLPVPPASKPSNVPWPTQPTPTPLTPDDKAAIKQAEAEHAAEQVKFDAQVAEAKMKAAGDRKAQADIARRARERQKALDDMKADIEAAKRGQ